jgi:hypothetical protein
MPFLTIAEIQPLLSNGNKFAGSDLDAIPDYSRDPAAFKQWKTRNGLGRGVGLKGLSVSASDSSPRRN